MTRRLVEAADKTIVLTDDSKLGKEAFAEIVPLEQVHTIVCNAPPPKEWQHSLAQTHLQWIVAK